jgi:hypothetical protein
MKSSINDLTKYYHSIKTFKVDKALFKQRCNRLLKRQLLTPALLKEAATLKPDVYFAKHAVRHTRKNINEQLIDVRDEYNKLESPVASYAAFRDRLTTFARKQQKMYLKAHTDVFNKAGFLSVEHWQYFIGSGCAKPFVYDEYLYPAIKEQQFLSVPSLLMETGKLDIKPLVLGRLKQGFSLDSAISEEKNTPKDGYGRIYKLSSSECNESYIGLTTLTLDERFIQHKISARKGVGSLLHQTMRRHGVETFSISLIEGCVPVSELSEREIHYIKDFNTRAPHGLNTSAGGQLGGCRGISSEVNGVDYKSLTEAGKAIETETKGAVRWFTAERRIRNRIRNHNREDIYAKTRKNSTHMEAGSNLFRRYLGLAKRKQLCHRWLDYDLFKLDVLKELTMMQVINQKLRLSKISDSAPYGPDNFGWFSRQYGARS